MVYIIGIWVFFGGTTAEGLGSRNDGSAMQDSGFSVRRCTQGTE